MTISTRLQYIYIVVFDCVLILFCDPGRIDIVLFQVGKGNILGEKDDVQKEKQTNEQM